MTAPIDRINDLFPAHLTSSLMQPGKIGKVSSKDGYPSTSQEKRDDVSIPDTIDLAPGDILFKEGDASGHAYFIETGELEIFLSLAHETQIVGLAKTGEVVGEMGVIDGLPRSTAAKAITQTRVRVIPAKRLSAMLENADPGMKALIRTLFARLRYTTQRLAEAEARY